MKISLILPQSVSLTLGRYSKEVVSGVLSAWSDLPQDVAKVVEWCGIEYDEGTHHHPPDVFTLKVKFNILLPNTGARIQREGEELLANFSTGIEARVRKIFRTLVLRELEIVIKDYRTDIDKVLRLLN